MEPESGSKGSSTVEPVQVTRTRTTTALLGAMLMHSIKRLASEADKAGRRPVIMLHYTAGTFVNQNVWNAGSVLAGSQ